MIFISTDYVFDGKNPPHKENDITNPLNKYGKSKLEGEKTVLGASSGWLHLTFLDLEYILLFYPCVSLVRKSILIPYTLLFFCYRQYCAACASAVWTSGNIR